jgi:hypothetical protein
VLRCGNRVAPARTPDVRTRRRPAQRYFSGDRGAQLCTPCPPGAFGPNASATACLPCPPPLFFSQAPATRQCSACLDGLYAVFYDAAARNFSACLPCPEGAQCPSLATMSVSSRYYAVRDPVTMAVETFLCDGGRCAASFTCGANRVAAADNPLCGQCLPGHSEWDGACVACSGANGGLVLGLLLLAWACVLAIHGFAQRSSTSSALRIAMFFWQVSFLVVGGAAWVRWAAFLNFDFFAAGSGSGSVCPFPVSPHGALVLQLLGPLMLPYAMLMATAGLHRGLGQLQRITRLPRFEATAYWRTCITLYFFTFNSVTRACLDFFNCATLPSGRYMVALPAVRCDEAAYHGLTPLVVVLLAAYAAVVPGLIGYRLHDARRRHRQAALDRSELTRVWSVVYGPLRAEAFWWSMAQMLARTALVAAAVFMRGDDHARYTVFALISVLSLTLVVHYKPNRSADDNCWELCTLAALALLVLSENMRAADAWLATLTLGVDAALAVRLGAQSLRRLANQRSADAGATDERGASRAARYDAPDAGGLTMSSTAYVTLSDEA